MRRVPLIRAAGGFFAALLAAGAVAESTATERFDADVASSHVTVEGTSTLHHWKVEGQSVEGYLSIDEQGFASLWTPGDPSSQALTPTVHVEIPVTSLMSSKRGMDEKMREALKATTHPTITYRLESAKIAGHQAAQAEREDEGLTIDTTGVLTVAGVNRSVDIPMQVKRLPDERLEVSGETPLQMTDFGIDPPTVMLGLLRTGNTVKVRWSWVLSRRDL